MYMKSKDWNGKDLPGIWDYTIKIDGVCALVREGVATSRRDKPLHNIPDGMPDGMYECFVGTFKDTIVATRTKNKKIIIAPNQMFLLNPLDYRLRLYSRGSGEKKYIESALKEVLSKGYEGLVLRKGDKWIKVKPVVTYDVTVIGFQLGTG